MVRDFLKKEKKTLKSAPNVWAVVYNHNDFFVNNCLFKQKATMQI